MSQLISSPVDCCRPCSEPIVTNIPGVPGATGAAGTNGTNGVNAFTLTTVPFDMPAEGANVVVTVEDSTWMAIEQILVVSVGGVFGWFEVVSKPTTTTVELKNLKSTATDEYMDNSAPGTVFANGAEISPGGLQGPAGVDGTGGAPTTAKYLVQTPVGGGVLPNEVPLSLVATGLLHNTNGTGALSAKTLGIADANVAPVSQVAGMTAGQAVFAVAAGIESKTAADTLAALGIGVGKMATQDANNVAITGGTITGVTITPPSGLIGGYLLFQHRETSGTAGGGFLNPSGWQTVPLNTEVVDTGGNGSIAANKITLATGVYRVRGSVVGNKVNSFQCRLWNDTAGAVEFYGSSEVANSGAEGTVRSLLIGRLTVTAGPKDYYVQASCETSEAVDGFGVPTGFGTGEIYSMLELEKET